MHSQTQNKAAYYILDIDIVGHVNQVKPSEFRNLTIPWLCLAGLNIGADWTMLHVIFLFFFFTHSTQFWLFGIPARYTCLTHRLPHRQEPTSHYTTSKTKSSRLRHNCHLIFYLRFEQLKTTQLGMQLLGGTKFNRKLLQDLLTAFESAPIQF